MIRRLIRWWNRLWVAHVSPVSGRTPLERRYPNAFSLAEKMMEYEANKTGETVEQVRARIRAELPAFLEREARLCAPERDEEGK